MNELVLSNKTALITGGSRGLGSEIAKAFLRNGASIITCSRNKTIEEGFANIMTEEVDLEKKNRIKSMTADISKTEDVDLVFDIINKEYGGIDILVNNAAVQGPIGRIEDIDWDEWQRALSINLSGTAYCMRKAIKTFRNTNRRGKIVSISGGGATGSRPFFSSYAAAKVAVVRLTEILADECREYGIDINAIAPGAMNTRMTDDILSAGINKAGEKEIETANKLKKSGDEVKAKAAELAVFLASEKSNGLSGKLISAVWDDWEHMHERIDEIMESDIYLLRRLVE